MTILAPPSGIPRGQFGRTWRRKTTRTVGDVTIHRLWAWKPTTENSSFPSRMAYYLLFPLHALVWLLFNYRSYNAIVTSLPPIFTGLAGLPFGVIGRKPLVVDVRDLWIDALITDSGGGVFLEEDPERLADTFETLLNDSEKRDSLGKAGREHVVEHDNRDVIAQRLEKLPTEVSDT